jgi:hypothetical protein
MGGELRLRICLYLVLVKISGWIFRVLVADFSFNQDVY